MKPKGDAKGVGPCGYVKTSSKGLTYTILEGEEWRRWTFLIQYCLQKFVEVLLIFGRLQSWNTTFRELALGCPSLECQVLKETF